eukprot:scaffold9489_cov107-Amphora_coffeaeformis.AAC.1
MVAQNEGSVTAIVIYSACGIGRQNHFSRSCRHGMVVKMKADKIIFHGHAGMEWLPSVAHNGGSHTPIAIYSACDIDEIIIHGHAGMEWLPLVAPNGGSDTPIAIYSACGY